jgi:hypothetical protein
MTEGFTGIITLLEQRKTAIDKALTALREVGEVSAPTQARPDSTATMGTSGRKNLTAPGRKGKKRSAAVRERMREAQRLRWAKIKGESEPPAAVTKEAPKPKRKISAEGIRKIIAATKKRWAKVHAEAKAALEQAEAKKAARKKAGVSAVKKSVPVRKAAPVKNGAVKEPAPAPESRLAQTAG